MARTKAQFQNMVNFDIEVKFDLEGQGQAPPPPPQKKKKKKKEKKNSSRDHNGGLLHLWSKFGYPSLNGWWDMVQTNLVTDGRTDVLTDRGRRRQ